MPKSELREEAILLRSERVLELTAKVNVAAVRDKLLHALSFKCYGRFRPTIPKAGN